MHVNSKEGVAGSVVRGCYATRLAAMRQGWLLCNEVGCYGDVPVFLSTQSTNQLLRSLQLLSTKVNLVLKVDLLLLVGLQFLLQNKYRQV